jgi:peptide/nickel transport system permease protein
MVKYLIRRLVLTLVTLLIVTFLIFGLMRLIPGDPAQLIGGEGQRSTEQLQAIRQQLRLDKPWYTEYFHWAGRVLRGDLGRSYFTNKPVTETVAQALPVSIELALMAMIVATVVAIPFGVISAMRQETWLDYGLRFASIAALSVPNFFVAVLLIALPAIWWKWAPPGAGYVPFVKNPWVNFQQFILPSLALGLAFSAGLMRITRSSMLEVLRQDYIRTATAKGLRERSVIYHHALKNALIPVVTLFGIQLGAILGGAVIIESIFRLPGLGQYTFGAISQRDFPVLQANVLIFAAGFLFINLIVDLSYGMIDPRIRIG